MGDYVAECGFMVLYIIYAGEVRTLLINSDYQFYFVFMHPLRQEHEL